MLLNELSPPRHYSLSSTDLQSSSSSPSSERDKGDSFVSHMIRQVWDRSLIQVLPTLHHAMKWFLTNIGNHYPHWLCLVTQPNTSTMWCDSWIICRYTWLKSSMILQSLMKQRLQQYDKPYKRQETQGLTASTVTQHIATNMDFFLVYFACVNVWNFILSTDMN